MEREPFGSPSAADGNSPFEQAKALVAVIQRLSLARDRESVVAIVRTAARELTGADGATFVLRENEHCHYVDEDAISPLWKGQRFPMRLCISGWVMANAQPAVIEDVFHDDRIPAEVYRRTFVKSLFMVPIRADCPIGAIGTYWARSHVPSRSEAELLQALAGSTALALENVAAFRELRERCEAFERHNAVLSMRLAEVKCSEAELRRDSLRDALTGLYNRRGFHALAQKAREIARREGRECTLVFADVDGLKSVNDRYGHASGDRLLVDAATVLGQCFRESDVIARSGGDEFIVFALGAEDEDAMIARITEAADRCASGQRRPVRLSLSVGSLPVRVDDEVPLESLIERADARMYLSKGRHRLRTPEAG